jgi:hypothetical protein
VRRKLPIYVLRRAGDMRRISPGFPARFAGFMRPLQRTPLRSRSPKRRRPACFGPWRSIRMAGRRRRRPEPC